IVSKAREDLPDPESPVNTMSVSRGSSRCTSFRLCSLAPRMTRWLALDSAFVGGVGDMGPIVPQVRPRLRGRIAEREFPTGSRLRRDVPPHGDGVRGWRHAPEPAGAPGGGPAVRRGPRRPALRPSGGPGGPQARAHGIGRSLAGAVRHGAVLRPRRLRPARDGADGGAGRDLDPEPRAA